MSVDVEQLTRDHNKAISTDDGIEFHSVPSLLSQLREAVFGGMESTGGSAPGSRLPISAGALDLYVTIDRQITEAWVASFGKVPGRERPEALVSQWAAHVQDETYVEVGGTVRTALDWASLWVQKIVDFFDPPRSTEIHAACIACNERYVWTIIDGRDEQVSALRFNRDRETGVTLDARCSACGTTWAPTQFEFLAESIGIDVAAKKAEHAKRMTDEESKTPTVS